MWRGKKTSAAPEGTALVAIGRGALLLAVLRSLLGCCSLASRRSRLCVSGLGGHFLRDLRWLPGGGFRWSAHGFRRRFCCLAGKRFATAFGNTRFFRLRRDGRRLRGNQY